MNQTPITAHYDYDNGYIILAGLQLTDIPETVSVNEKKLFKKSEFHISLVCVKRLVPLIAPDDVARQAELAEAITEHFKAYVQRQSLTEYWLTGELRYVVKDDGRETIVALCQLPGLAGFFAQIEQEYGTKLPLPPTHITLYTLQPEAPIGIMSNEELEAISQPITLPELSSLARA